MKKQVKNVVKTSGMSKFAPHFLSKSQSVSVKGGSSSSIIIEEVIQS